MLELLHFSCCCGRILTLAKEDLTSRLRNYNKVHPSGRGMTGLALPVDSLI